jgi:hypothetical protein
MSHSKTSRCRPAHRIGRHAARYLPSHRRAHKAQAAGVVRLKIESNNRYDEQIHGSDLRQVIAQEGAPFRHFVQMDEPEQVAQLILAMPHGDAQNSTSR